MEEVQTHQTCVSGVNVGVEKMIEEEEEGVEDEDGELPQCSPE